MNQTYTLGTLAHGKLHLEYMKMIFVAKALSNLIDSFTVFVL